MAALDMSFEHGQTIEIARDNFETGISHAEQKFGAHIRSIDWAEDRSSVRLKGTGYDIVLLLDERHVHARGTVPFFAKMFEGPVRRFIEETFRKGPSG